MPYTLKKWLQNGYYFEQMTKEERGVVLWDWLGRARYDATRGGSIGTMDWETVRLINNESRKRELFAEKAKAKKATVRKKTA